MAVLPAALERAFPPSADALLHLARAGVDDSMLREIARADYGMDEAGHLAALRPIRDHGIVPVPMGWEPKEVLELIRWSQPEDPGWKPGSTGERGHRMRAFACAALLRAAAEPPNDGYFGGENSTLAQVIESALELGPEVQEAAARFLTWRTPGMGEDDERPFFAFGLLALAVLLRAGRLSDDDLAAAARWVLAEEAAERAALGAALPPNAEEWLLGLTFFNSRDTVWRRLAGRIATEAAAIPPGDARDALVDVAVRLV